MYLKNSFFQKNHTQSFYKNEMTGQNETIEGILFLQGRSLIGKSVYDFVGFSFIHKIMHLSTAL